MRCEASQHVWEMFLWNHKLLWGHAFYPGDEHSAIQSLIELQKQFSTLLLKNVNLGFNRNTGATRTKYDLSDYSEETAEYKA